MKKILLSLGLAMALVVGVVGMSAFEAHVVNVTATISNATEISTEHFTFGTVYPQEILHSPVTLSLSKTFTDNGKVWGVDYMIKQKPKCILIPTDAPTAAPLPPYAQVTEDGQGNFVCPQYYELMPLLCPFLSKTSPDANDTSVPSFHGPIDLALWTDQVSFDNRAIGHLNQQDPSTTWDIDMHVPCFKGQCAQDWASYVKRANEEADPNAYLIDPLLKGQELGCDLWYEVTGVDREIPE